MQLVMENDWCESNDVQIMSMLSIIALNGKRWKIVLIGNVYTSLYGDIAMVLFFSTSFWWLLQRASGTQVDFTASLL